MPIYNPITVSDQSDRSHAIQENPNERFFSDFENDDQYWEEAESYVTSTFSISNGELSVIANATPAFRTSPIHDKRAYAKNFVSSHVISENDSGGNGSTFQFRIEGTTDFGYIRLNDTDGDFEIWKNSSNSLTKIVSFSITGYSSDGNYEIVVKVFQNLVNANIYQSGLLLQSIEATTDTDLETLTGTNTGLATGDGTTKYSEFGFQKIDAHTHIIFAGDSNSDQGFYGLAYSDYYYSKVLSKFKYDSVSISPSGTSGNKTTDITSAIDARVNDRFVNDARNIVMFFVGTNDVNGSDDVNTIWTNYQAMLNALTEPFEVWVATYPPRTEEDIAEFNDGSSQLSTWSVSGVDEYNSDKGILYVSLTDSGGTRTVGLYSDSGLGAGDLVAQGSLAGDGSITLAEQNSSGISGSVTVAYTTDDTDIEIHFKVVKMKAFNKILRENIRTVKPEAKVIDLASALTDTDGFGIDAYYVNENHYNADGHSLIANKINAKLEEPTDEDINPYFVSTKVGSKSEGVRTIAAATGTITTSDSTIIVDYTTTGICTLTLPSASDCFDSETMTGKIFTIKDLDANAGANNITINRAGSDTIIDSVAGETSTVIDSNGGAIHIQAISSTEWIVF